MGIDVVFYQAVLNQGRCASKDGVPRKLFSPSVSISSATNRHGFWNCRPLVATIGAGRYYTFSTLIQTRAGCAASIQKKLLLDPYARCIFFLATFDRSTAILGRHRGVAFRPGHRSAVNEAQYRVEWTGTRTFRPPLEPNSPWSIAVLRSSCSGRGNCSGA